MKTETKHTPGPWRAHSGKPVYGAEANPQLVEIQNQDPLDPRCIAWANPNNARLIAAAPDLLEACKALVEGFDAVKDATLFEMMGPHGADQEGRRIQARAAIQKAEGAL